MGRAPRIPISKPTFTADELAAVQRPLETGWLVQGPFVKEFEDRFAAFTGARACVATTSCTTALHLAVAVLGLGPRDEVIVPAFTWISTVNVVEYMGATPVFCDIDLRTFNVDPTLIEPLITPRTVGIIAVHLFGLCANMDPILALARRHGLWVVEDAACALGSYYHGKHAGTLSDVGCFSFHPRKTLTTGEGGMITTMREEVAGLAVTLRDHGASSSDLSRHTGQNAFLLPEYGYLGYNYRMTDIQGALGCAQMRRVGQLLEARQRLAQTYDSLLGAVEWLRPPIATDGCSHSYQSYVCLTCPDDPTLANAQRIHERRNRLMGRLEASGIATRQGTHAPVIQQYYRTKYSLRPEQFPNAYLADRLTLALPLYPDLQEAEQAEVVTTLTRCW